MTDVVIASNEADARAAEAMEQHHAQLSGMLAAMVERLVAAASRGEATRAREARARLAAWCQQELVPHAWAEEQTLYPAARVTPDGRLLVEAMMTEHEVITGLVRSLSDDTAAGAGAGDPGRAAADAVALRAMFDSHLGKENDLLLPALDAAGVDLGALLDGMHEILGSISDSPPGDGCGCGCQHAPGDEQATSAPLQIATTTLPAPGSEASGLASDDLDVRTLPHGQRHEIIFGRLDALAGGEALVIVNDHDPKPLRYQTEALWPERFAWSYQQAGPHTWRIAITRAH